MSKTKFLNVVTNGVYSNHCDLKTYEMKCDCVKQTKMKLNGEKNGTLTTFRGHDALASSGQKYGQQLSHIGMIIIAILNVLTQSCPRTIVYYFYCLLLVLTCDCATSIRK